jgi:hypothetical protein
MTPFENALMIELAAIRKTFGDRDCSHLTIEMKAEGPTLRDEIKITFEVSEYGWDVVKGSNLAACITEYFRRKGWKENNDYLALPNVDQPRSDDDIKF